MELRVQGGTDATDRLRRCVRCQLVNRSDPPTKDPVQIEQVLQVKLAGPNIPLPLTVRCLPLDRAEVVES